MNLLEYFKAQTKKEKNFKKIFLGSIFFVVFFINSYLLFLSSIEFKSLIIENGQIKTGVSRFFLQKDFIQELEVYKKFNGVIGIKIQLKHENKNYKYPNFITVNFTKLDNVEQNFQLKIKKNKFRAIYTKTIKFKQQQKGVWHINYFIADIDGAISKSNYKIIVE